MDRASFARAIRGAQTPEDRVAWFGAMLAAETERAIEVVGGSAIEVYLSSSEYVSEDIDLVGDKSAIESVLTRWGFRQIMGRSKRSYWVHKGVGLVDLVGLTDRSGLSPRKVATPFGPVLLSSPEPLLVRRLVRAKRENSENLFEQAVSLARLPDLDWEYIEIEARYENVEATLARLRASLRRRIRTPSTTSHAKS